MGPRSSGSATLNGILLERFEAGFEALLDSRLAGVERRARDGQVGCVDEMFEEQLQGNEG